MVTRRFKKGSVYDALASTSGLDFSPIVQLKTYHRRDDTSPSAPGTKPSEKIWENSAKFSRNSPSKENDAVFYKDKPKQEPSDKSSCSLSTASPTQENKNSFTPNAKTDIKDPAKCIAAHEKYPSWPVTSSSSNVSFRSHSWTGQTDYPKEKLVYSRPKKSNQFKISTNQLQPVLERASDYSNKSSPESYCHSDRKNSAENYNLQYPNYNVPECGSKQFDFEAFHTPCIPQCYEEKDYRIHSPPERDISSPSSVSGPHEESQSGESNGFISRYEEVLRHQAQYSVPLSSSWSKQRNVDGKGVAPGPDTPFLDRLRLESAWQMPPPPVPMIPANVNPQQQQQQPPLQQQGNDFELSSENGTWMGSMESSSHGRGIPKWQGSYSDLSTLSTQLSNRSSLFDSGHSTMPESGRLSPQSSCDSTAPSLLLEGPTRAQVVARHGCHREIIAHSARVQQPERHGSESVLYYATGSSSRLGGEKMGFKKSDSGSTSGSQLPTEEAMYRSQASVTLSPSLLKSNNHEVPDCQNKINKCPSRQDSRKSSNSFSSEDSFPRSRSHCGDDTSGSSSDISNITCISNYKGTAKSKSLDETSPARDVVKPVNSEQSYPIYKNGYEPPKSKSMDETSRKFIFPDMDKRQRISDPDLKAIQKQAVMSFYQRMSLAESIKSEQKCGLQGSSEMEPPPPYEATPHSRMNMYAPKLSLMPKKLNPHKQWDSRNSNQISQHAQKPVSKSSDSELLNHHSKSVPNLVALKGQSLDLHPSHPIYKRASNGASWINANNNNNLQVQRKRGSPLEKDEIISWDQLPNVLEKKREAIEKAALSSETKDPPEDNGSCSSGMHYFKSHKSPRKVQLKEVHHSNETASVKVMTPDGVTLVQTHEQRRDDKLGAAPPPPHKRRPAPPPPPKQPPKRPPPPPPPVTPPPQVVVVVNGNESENLDSSMGEMRIDVKGSPASQLPVSASSPQLGVSGYASPSMPPPASSYCGGECPSSPELPLPPPPKSQGTEIMSSNDEPLPPPPDGTDVNVQHRMLDSSSLIYPKNSYMSYRSERKLGRQGFDGKYRRSFHTSASSVDLTTLGSSFQEGKEGFSPNSWEQMHNIRQRGTTVIFHSDCLQPDTRLQRSSSQDCVLAEEPPLNKTDNISNSKQQESECKQSSTSINTQCSNNQGVPLQSVPYSPASHERNTQNSFSDSQQNDFTKVASSQSPDNSDTINGDSSALDNRIFTDDSFVDTESDTSNFSNVDHNQNAVKNNHSEDNSRIQNGSDLNRINSATQTADTLKMRRKYAKTKEEEDCEQLSIDFINQCGDTALKNILIPSPNHKTISDYMEGLLHLELESGGFPIQRNRTANNPPNNENKQRDEKWISNERCNSLFSSKMKINHSVEMNDNQCSDEENDLKKRKEELIQSIERKVDTFRNEQTYVREEMLHNELLGQEIATRLQKVAKPNELEKYSLHVEEMEKIVNLLLSLSGRLARAENILKNMPKEGSPEERKILEAKREKLREQHEDARRLKESIDRRSNQVSTFLHRYFTDDEYTDYDRFIKLKIKLIVDIRELDEKINLGEEQLAALNVVAHLWKSANS